MANWILHHSFRQIFPAGRRGRFFPIFAALGVAIGVAVLIVVISIMNGFQENIRRQLRDWHGDIAIFGITKEDGPLRDFLENFDGILSVAAFWDKPMLLWKGDRHVLAPTRGLSNVEGLHLGKDLMGEMGVGEKDAILILPLDQFLMEKEVFFPEEMVLSTPSAPSGLAKISLNTLQAISGECSIDGYQLKLRRGVGVESLASRIGKYLEPPIQVRTWREAGGELVAMLAMEKSAMFLSLSCIIAMAAFCMASALAGNVARKTQEIGLLLAIGCSKGGIALSFLLQSLGIGVLGIAIGSCLAAGILSMRDGLLRLLMTTFGGEERLFSFYGFSHLPLHVHGGDVVKIFILAIAATLVAGLLPVCRILRIDPSQALHHE